MSTDQVTQSEARPVSCGICTGQMYYFGDARYEEEYRLEVHQGDHGEFLQEYVHARCWNTRSQPDQPQVSPQPDAGVEVDLGSDSRDHGGFIAPLMTTSDYQRGVEDAAHLCTKLGSYHLPTSEIRRELFRAADDIRALLPSVSEGEQSDALAELIADGGLSDVARGQVRAEQESVDATEPNTQESKSGASPALSIDSEAGSLQHEQKGAEWE